MGAGGDDCDSISAREGRYGAGYGRETYDGTEYYWFMPCSPGRYGSERGLATSECSGPIRDGYVGGFAQGASEESLMHEIQTRGPVVMEVAVEGLPKFDMPKKGVASQKGSTKVPSA